MTNTPHPTDVYVGQQLRTARLVRGMSQSILAAHVGLTFQQLQKYEKAHNRVSPGKLLAFAQHLDYPISYFYPEGADAAPGMSTQQGNLLKHARKLNDESLRALTRLAASFAAIDSNPASQ